MSKQTKEERIETLKATQEARKQETLAKVNKAIERLVRTGAKISFAAVAREANVSVPYLYKYPDLKERIQALRAQQSKIPENQVNLPPVTAKKHSQVISRLKKRIQQLEEDNKELRRKNEALAGQVYRVHALEEQVERQKDLILTLEARVKSPKADVIPISRKAKPTDSTSEVTKTPPIDFKERVKQETESMGISLNTTHNRLIKKLSVEEVLNALEAVKDQLEKNDIENPEGLLTKALKEKWTKGKPSSPPETPQSEPETSESTPIVEDGKTLVSSDKLKRLHSLFGE
jgi:AcrR family transcriptional regulator